MHIDNNTIIISENREEARKVHEAIGKDNFNVDTENFPIFKDENKFLYDGEWIWVWDGKSLSGTSGYNSLKHTIKMHPNFLIRYVNNKL